VNPLARLLRLAPIVLLAACYTHPKEDPPPSRFPVAETPDAIAERFLRARRSRNAERMWGCFAGEVDKKRVYQRTRDVGYYRTWREFKADVKLGFENPPLAPHEEWEKLEERQDGDLRVLVFRQGREEVDPSGRGRLLIAAEPAGTGWLVAWVGVTY
jgi:hypothetical protein